MCIRDDHERRDLGGARDVPGVVAVLTRATCPSPIPRPHLEPQSCTVSIDRLGNLAVFASTQALFHTRAAVCRVLGRSEHQVTVTA